MISFRLFCIGIDPVFFKCRALLLDVADKLEEFFLNPSQKVLNLSMPPRMGKSYLLTLFSVWAFAQKFMVKQRYSECVLKIHCIRILANRRNS